MSKNEKERNPMKKLFRRFLQVMMSLAAISLVITAYNCAEAETKKEFKVAIANSCLNTWGFNTVKGFCDYFDTKKEEGFTYQVSEVQKDGDIVETVEIVDELIATGVNGIVLIPTTSKALRETLEIARKGGVKFGTVGTTLGYPKFHPDAPDFVLAGVIYPTAYKMAKMAIEKIGGKGNVVLINGDEGSDVAEDTKRGWEDGCAEYPGINIIYNDYVGWTGDVAYDVMADILVKHEKIDLVLAICDSPAIGAHEAAAAVGREHEMVFTGWDAIPDFVELMVKEPNVYLTVANWGHWMGYYAAQSLYLALTDIQNMRTYVEIEYQVLTVEDFKKMPQYQPLFKE